MKLQKALKKYSYTVFCILLTGCSNLKLSGEYNYTREDISNIHRNTLVLTYSGKIKDMPYRVMQKINHDPIYSDKPPFYETSYEIYFW